jgi:hypothetical protein
VKLSKDLLLLLHWLKKMVEGIDEDVNWGAFSTRKKVIQLSVVAEKKEEKKSWVHKICFYRSTHVICKK